MNHNGNNEHPQGGFTSAQPFELSLMGTRQKGPQGEKEAGTALTPIERHYAVTEIAEIWHLSTDKVRDLFEDEPGVLVIGQRSSRRKRRYVTLRIPHSVVERVHARLLLKTPVR
jgi:hypothetical protein